MEAVEQVERIPAMGAAAVKAIGRFGELIASLRERAERRGPVAELLESTLSESGYIEALEAERTVEAEGRIENLQELIGMAAEFDANRELEGESELPPLEEFLEQISLINEQDALVDDGSKVTLMTLHNAKGLEYEAVFMIGCEDGVFPHSRSIDEGSLEEERRLCYVGLTRARKRLTLTYARRRSIFGASGTGIPSRFLGEIPSHLVERHSTAMPATGWGTGSFGAGSQGAGSFQAVPDPGPALELTVGDDVVHASFGEGVVTAVEPGNVIVVRFRGQDGDRKLMADYAPIQKAS
jgi:DNA helicase-2/ATP-dependent DNA helicase PcrA